MYKAIFILIILVSAYSNVLSQDSGGLIGGSGNISISPFNPIRFTRFISYMISLPFRIIGMIFGLPFGSSGTMRNSGGSGVSNNGKGGGIFNIFLSLPRGIARFIEEIFHFIRLLLDSIFGNLESGAAYIAGDGVKSQTYRMNRNRTASSS